MFRSDECAKSEVASRTRATPHATSSGIDSRADSSVGDALSVSPYESVARAIRRGIVCVVACLALTLVARLVELSCELSQPTAESLAQAPMASSPNTQESGRNAIIVLQEYAAATASVGISSIRPLAAAFGALGLGSILVIAAGRSPRAGATVTGLAVSAAIVASAESVGDTLRSLHATWVSLVWIGASLGALLVVAWRCVEDVALAAALAARVDAQRIVEAADHAMQRAVESETSLIRERGVELRDSASRILARVLTTNERSSSVEQPAASECVSAQLGFGSPLPPRPQDASDSARRFPPSKVDPTSHAA